MTPESITVSLEWAKKLKEAGWPQDEQTVNHWRRKGEIYSVGGFTTWCLAAPTAEEILRRLPDYIGTEYVLVTVRDHPENKWSVNYIRISEKGVNYHPDHEFRARPCDGDSLANAAAAMWCYLAENKLLPKQDASS